MEEITYDLNESLNKLFRLPEVDNKETVLLEIEALEDIREKDRLNMFGSENILWILKNYSVSEMKDKARKFQTKPDLKVGDVVRFNKETFGYGIIFEIVGRYKDRLTILKKSEYSHYEIIQGVSAYDVQVVSEGGLSHVDLEEVLKVLPPVVEE